MTCGKKNQRGWTGSSGIGGRETGQMGGLSVAGTVATRMGCCIPEVEYNLSILVVLGQMTGVACAKGLKHCVCLHMVGVKAWKDENVKCEF
jgi:hypothetical protein